MLSKGEIVFGIIFVGIITFAFFNMLDGQRLDRARDDCFRSAGEALCAKYNLTVFDNYLELGGYLYCFDSKNDTIIQKYLPLNTFELCRSGRATVD
jgi:hypothetical protein